MVDFAALRRRLYPAASRAHQLSVETLAAYIVFDLLAIDGPGRAGRAGCLVPVQG
jgi:ATP-dependent DNA ligase